MGRVMFYFLICILVGCGAPPYKPDRPHPTPERLEELMKLTKPPVVTSVKDLTLRVMPNVAMEGQAARLTCLVPPDTCAQKDKSDPTAHRNHRARKVRLELTGQTMHRAFEEDNVDKIEYVLLVDKLACGQQIASCTIVTFDRRVIQRTDTVLVKGLCDDGQR